jgi:hypothetical protein
VAQAGVAHALRSLLGLLRWKLPPGGFTRGRRRVRRAHGFNALVLLVPRGEVAGVRQRRGRRGSPSFSRSVSGEPRGTRAAR